MLDSDPSVDRTGYMILVAVLGINKPSIAQSILTKPYVDVTHNIRCDYGAALAQMLWWWLIYLASLVDGIVG